MKKYIIYFCILICNVVLAQHNSDIEKSHLENKHNISIGFNSSTTEISYELKTSDHFSVGVFSTFYLTPNKNEDYIYNKDKFSLNIRGRYYFKHFITHSFLYLFFDDHIKIRYFGESSLGYAYSSRNTSYRYIDDNKHFVINRKQQNENAMKASFGVGAKLLLHEKFSLDYSVGGGNYIFSQKKDTGFGYFRIGIGYRF